MKKLTQISLHNLSQAELAKKEENLLRGGDFKCACAGSSCVCVNGYIPGTPEYWEDFSTKSIEELKSDMEITFVVYDSNY